MNNLTLQYFVFLLLFVECFSNVKSSEEERSPLDQFVEPWRIFRKLMFNGVLEQNRRNGRYLLEIRNKVQKIVPTTTSFPCNVETCRSAERPTSVHKLRPGDIDVIGALGDSLTAGTGLTAVNILDLYLEERGQSFSIGGEANWRKYVTLPNILKEFNPNLTGYSLGPSLTIDKISNLNVAEVGAISSNIPYMTKVLIERIKSDKQINFEKDWKMVNIFIGCNNFCSEICYKNDLKVQLEKHRQDMIQVLRLLRDNLPRTIVNVIPPPNLKVLRMLQGRPPVCYFLHLMLCPCLFGARVENKLQSYFNFMESWQQIDLNLQGEEEFNLDDFTVVVQPLFLNYSFPKLANGNGDYSFLSEDCFHFSQKGDARVANDLWNNLMEPVGNKSRDGHSLFEKFKCPSEKHPYIYTIRNS